MRLRTVSTIAAVLACLSPAVAMVTNLPLALVDIPPQVFVAEGTTLRGARPEDDPAAPVFDATGTPLSFTLEKWRAGNGSLDIGPNSDGAGDRVDLTLHRLIAFGHYSVFVRTDDADAQKLAPLDGSGLTNNFDARFDGSANVTITTPQHLASGQYIVTIYHSDAQDHGNSPGDLTRTAHEQLIAKVP